MKLRDLFAVLRLKSDQASKDLKDFDEELDKTKDGLGDAEKGTEKLGRRLKGLGRLAKGTGAGVAKGVGIIGSSLAVAGAGLGVFVASWAEAADTVGKDAGKFEVAADELQGLTHAAELAGSSGDKLKDALKDLGLKVRETLENPLSDAGKVFATLGINVEEFARLGAQDRLATLADALTAVDDKSARLSFRVRLLGEAGIDLGELFREGAKGVNKYVKEAEDLGGIMGDDALKAAADFNDELARSQLVFKGVRNEVASKLAPVFTGLLRQWRSMSKAQREVIATRILDFLQRLIRLAEQFLPQLLGLAEGTAEFVEQIGGIDTALFAVIGTFSAFKIAAFAALGPAAPWVAGIVGAITLIGTLASAIEAAGDEAEDVANRADDRQRAREDEKRKSRSRSELTERQTAEELQKTEAGRRLLAARAARNAEEQARDDLEKRQKQELDDFTKRQVANIPRFAGPRGDGAAIAGLSRLRSFQSKQADALEKATARVAKSRNSVAEAEEALAIETEKNAHARRRENRVKQKAEDEDRRKKAAEEQKLRRELIKLQTKTKRSRSETARLKELSERFNVPFIPTPKGPGKVFGETGDAKDKKKPPTINELIAAAVGQGTGLGGAALRPAGLGTTINHIDASLRVQAPQIVINIDELPETASAREVAKEVQATVGTTFLEQLREAFDIQVRQVQG